MIGRDAFAGVKLSRDQMEQRRLAGARDLANGKTQAEVARKYGVSQTTAHRWDKAHK